MTKVKCATCDNNFVDPNLDIRHPELCNWCYYDRYQSSDGPK